MDDRQSTTLRLAAASEMPAGGVGGFQQDRLQRRTTRYAAIDAETPDTTPTMKTNPKTVARTENISRSSP
jgi:hypothetical protein